MRYFLQLIISLSFIACGNQIPDEMNDINVQLLTKNISYVRGGESLTLSSHFLFNSDTDINGTVHSICVVDDKTEEQSITLSQTKSVLISSLLPMKSLIYNKSHIANCNFTFDFTNSAGSTKRLLAEDITIDIRNEMSWTHPLFEKAVANKYLGELDGAEALYGFNTYNSQTDVLISCEDTFFTKSLFKPYQMALSEIMAEQATNRRLVNFIQKCRIVMRDTVSPYGISFTPEFTYTYTAPRLVIKKFDFVLDYYQQASDVVKRPIVRAAIYNPSSSVLKAAITNYNQSLHLETASLRINGTIANRGVVSTKKLFAELTNKTAILDNSNSFVFKIAPKETVLLNIFARPADNCGILARIGLTPQQYSQMNHYNWLIENSPPSRVAFFFFPKGFPGLSQVDNNAGDEVIANIYNQLPNGLIKHAHYGYIIPHPKLSIDVILNSLAGPVTINCIAY